MSEQSQFEALIKKGNPVGEVISVNSFLVKVSGLQPCALNSLVMFEDGSKGYVYQILSNLVVILHLGSEPVRAGMIAVIQHEALVCKVGKGFVGRVISINGDPLDGKGPIVADDVWPVFNEAPKLYERKLVEDQVESGVSVIDALFPIVKGQRMAMLGESKSGKSTIAAQFLINQKNTDQITVYCLIAKRRSDIDTLLSRLTETNSLDKAVIVVATMFESLINSYLAPYIACAISEYLWQRCDQDTIVIYDDLTSHAQAYREISLLAGVSPGRDSYPGDAFYAHSSLLERAGRLARSGKSLTAIPLVHVPNGDITAFLPTNIMSITDGQWILDMTTFRSGVRPAINIGLSVTRAGGAGHNDRQKDYAARTLKLLASYRQAQEYAHFGAELSADAQHTLAVGKLIFDILTQAPSETYSLMEQQLMFAIILDLADTEQISTLSLKEKVKQYAVKVTSDEEFDKIRDELKAECIIGGNKAAPPADTNPPANNPVAGDDQATPVTPPPGEEAKPDSSEAKPEELKHKHHWHKEKAEV